ncbi:MAG: peptidylprolyl isomerase [Anaerolineae bacterium]|nr:peptidylprolyl isomerase [Anaerolineae bacterium]
MTQRYVLIGTSVAVGLIVLILVAAVVLELFVNPNRVVASVNGDNISVSQFQEQVRIERALLNLRINNFITNLNAMGIDPNQFAGQEPLRTWLAQVQIPDQLGNSVVTAMVEDALVRQQAAALGISVSAEDVDKQWEQFLGFDPNALAGIEPTATVEPTITPTPFVSPTPSPVPTATLVPTIEATEEATSEATVEVTEPVEPTATYTPVPPPPTLTADEQMTEFASTKDAFMASITASARVPRDRLNQYFEMQALRTALRDAVTDLSAEVPHVNARHILVATEEEAQDILAALQAGDSFAGLAQASSTDTGSGATGGELGWTPVTDFVNPFADAVTDGDLGALIGPIQTEFGWHIIQVHDREIRTITANQLDTAKERQFQTWLDDLRASTDQKIEIDSVWADNVPAEPAFVLNGG